MYNSGFHFTSSSPPCWRRYKLFLFVYRKLYITRLSCVSQEIAIKVHPKLNIFRCKNGSFHLSFKYFKRFYHLGLNILLVYVLHRVGREKPEDIFPTAKRKRGKSPFLNYVKNCFVFVLSKNVCIAKQLATSIQKKE